MTMGFFISRKPEIYLVAVQHTRKSKPRTGAHPARDTSAAELIKSQKLLRETERIGKVGGWEFSIDTGKQTWTEETYRIHELGLDYQPTVTGGIDFYTPESRPTIERAVRNAIEHGEAFDVELEITTAKGNVRTVIVIGHPDIEHGRIHGFVQDITERKRGEAIRLARLRLMEFAHSHDLHELLTATLDEVGLLTRSPIGFYHFVESDQKTLSLQAWSTRTAREFCTAEGTGRHYGIEDAGVWADCVRLGRPLIHNDYGSLENRRGMPPGHASVIRELVVPIFRNAKIVAILGVGNKASPYEQADEETVTQFADLAWDIAESTRASAALRKSEELLRSMTAAVPGVVYQCLQTPNGGRKFTYLSDRVEMLYEVSAESARQDYNVLTSRIPADDRAAYWESEAAISGLWEHEHRIRMPDGSLKWIRDEATPQRQQDGSVLWSGILTDITERKNIEAELERYRHNLEELVSSRTAELAAARDAAEGANRAKSAFLATTSHELRTPLNAIIGFSSVMLDGGTGDLPAEQRKQLSIIRRSGEELLVLVRDILDLSSIEAGNLVIHAAEVRLLPVLCGLSDAFRIRAGERSLEMRPVVCDESIMVLADVDRLSQVIRNLLGNAVKFTDHGHVQVRATVHEDSVRIAVEDSGIGIPADKQSLLFHPFQRITDPKGPLRQGTGLGLSICKRIVEAMGGEIGVESQPGQGSRFWFTVPLSSRIH